jgi:DNA-binding GntR family transcriptional regulator
MSIADYIKEDLAARMKSGRALPVQLTLDSLAEHYNVSFTPVRTAVAELIDEGLLEKGPNRRLTAIAQPDAGKRTARASKLPEPPRNPFDVIASDLVRLSLKGEQVYLREEVTAEKYDISRSAMRYILHRLAGEGMLDHIPRRGWRLRPFRQDDLRAYLEAREALELRALDLAWPKLDAKELERMLDANAPPTSAKASASIDESLHDYILTTAGNSYIKDFFVRQGRYYRLLFQSPQVGSFVWKDNLRAITIETGRQHREILAALLRKRRAAARKALSHHILNNHPLLRQISNNTETRSDDS